MTTISVELRAKRLVSADSMRRQRQRAARADQRQHFQDALDLARAAIRGQRRGLRDQADGAALVEQVAGQDWRRR